MLFRYFDEERFAVAFANEGKVRLRLQSSYKGMEDVGRRDPTEGDGHYIVSGLVRKAMVNETGTDVVELPSDLGPINVYASFGRDPYILCLTQNPDPAMGSKKFGRWRVRIADVEELISNVRKFVGETYGSGTFVLHDKVAYDKGESRLVSDRASEGMEAAMFQKPRMYSEECEYRVCVVLPHKCINNAVPDKYLMLELGSLSKIAIVEAL